MNIILASRQYELKEINVSAEKPPFRISGGNIVANIPSLPGHESASIGKMLERLPGVTSSPEGGYRLNGSEAIVYIDGIKQQVPAEVLHSILESMPASAIEEVELVSLPGSNYDMTKNPVIHIHKKKIRQDGWYIQPSIDGSVMENAHGSAEIQAYFSMQKKKFWANAYAYSDEFTEKETHVREDTLWNRIRKDCWNKVHVINMTANAGYTFEHGESLNFNFLGYFDMAQQPETWRSSGNGFPESVSSVRKRPYRDLWSFYLDFRNQDSLRSHYKLSYGYVWGVAKDKQFYYMGDEALESMSYLGGKSRMRGGRHTITGLFRQKLSKKMKLSFGAEANLGNLQEKVGYAPYHGYAMPTLDTISRFHGKEDIIGAYAAYRYDISSRFALDLGFRYDYTFYNMYQGKNPIRQDFGTWYGTAALYAHAGNYNTGIGLQVYTKRVPYAYYLPGKHYMDDATYASGNPDLHPSRYYALVWNNAFWKKVGFFARYAYVEDYVGAIFKEYEGITVSTYANYADMQYVSLSLSLPFAFWKNRVSGNIQAIGEWQHFLRFKDGYGLPEGRPRQFWGAQVQASLNVSVTDRLDIYVWGTYRSPVHHPLYDKNSTWGMDIGASYAFLKNKELVLSLEAINLFDSFAADYTYYYGNMVRNDYSHYVSRCVELKLSYRFQTVQRPFHEPDDVGNDISRFKF